MKKTTSSPEPVRLRANVNNVQMGKTLYRICNDLPCVVSSVYTTRYNQTMVVLEFPSKRRLTFPMGHVTTFYTPTPPYPLSLRRRPEDDDE